MSKKNQSNYSKKLQMRKREIGTYNYTFVDFRGTKVLKKGIYPMDMGFKL